jgi:formate dehydrogenase subunit gamma
VAETEVQFGLRMRQPDVNAALGLDRSFCFGNCHLGPSVEIGGQLYGNIDETRLVALIRAALRELRPTQQMPARLLG